MPASIFLTSDAFAGEEDSLVHCASSIVFCKGEDPDDVELLMIVILRVSLAFSRAASARAIISLWLIPGL